MGTCPSVTLHTLYTPIIIPIIIIYTYSFSACWILAGHLTFASHAWSLTTLVAMLYFYAYPALYTNVMVSRLVYTSSKLDGPASLVCMLLVCMIAII